MTNNLDDYLESLTQKTLLSNAMAIVESNEKDGITMTARQAGWINLNVFIQCLCASASALRITEGMEPLTPNGMIELSGSLINAVLPFVPVESPVIIPARIEREALGN